MYDKRVREALLSSLDRETYCKVLLKDTFTPGGPLMPPSVDYGFDQLKDPNTYNVERAKKLLEEAGWKDTNGDGYVDKNGQKLILRWLTYPGRQELPLLAEIAQANLKTIGIDLKINNTINQQEFLANGNWDIYASAFVTAPTGDPEYFFTTHCLQNSAKNRGKYYNDKLEILAQKLHMNSIVKNELT